MSYFVYNGISSQIYGILERCPIPPQAEEQYETINIPGRSETVCRKKKNKPDITLQLVLGMKNLGKLRDCYRWLTGTGELILSSRPTEKLIVKKIKTSPEYLSRRFGKITITMTASPYVYSVAETEIDATAYKTATPLTNNGSEIALPLITFTLAKDEDAVLMGDVDMDGKVTAADASMLQAAVTANDFTGWTDKQLRAADMDGDGVINIADVSHLLVKIAEMGALGDEGTPYDVYLNINGRVMRVSVPQICSVQELPVTIDSAAEIVYYTDVDGNKINILDRTYGDLPYLDPGDNTFHFSCDVEMLQMTIRKNERW